MVGAIEFGTPINPAVPEGPSESANQDVVDLLGPNHRAITHARVSSNIHPPSLEISKMMEDEVILTAILFRSVARIVDSLLRDPGRISDGHSRWTPPSPPPPTSPHKNGRSR